MRIAIVSDIHGNLAALDAVSADLARHEPDLVIHLGDLAVLGPRPAAVVDRIRELGWPGVLGNTDEMLWAPARQEEQERRAPKLRTWLHTLFATLAPWAREHLGAERIAWLRTLPREWRHHDPLAVHASPGDLWSAPMPDAQDRTLVDTYGGRGASLVAYGHIHRPYVRRLPELSRMARFSAALRVAATSACIGSRPYSTIKASSRLRSPCGLNGVPASVPAAIFIPDLTAALKL